MGSETTSYYRIAEIPVTYSTHYGTGFEGLDRLLSGGLVAGATILLAGTPGVGKSTLLLQISNNLAKNGYQALYISGEEHLTQLRERAKRLGTLAELVYCSTVTDVEEIHNLVDEIRPAVMVVDSLQTMHSSESSRAAGTPTQMRLALHKLTNLARRAGSAIIIVGHSTKRGRIAGLQTLQHMVDTTLFMGNDGELRLLKVQKNRYGPSQRLWAAKMTERGLVEIELPREGADEGGSDPLGCLTGFALGLAPLLVFWQLIQPKRKKL